MLFPVPSAWGAGPYFIHILFACASGEERKGGREDLAFNMRIINGGASPVMAAMSLILRRYCVPIPEGSGCGSEGRVLLLYSLLMPETGSACCFPFLFSSFWIVFPEIEIWGHCGIGRCCVLHEKEAGKQTETSIYSLKSDDPFLPRTSHDSPSPPFPGGDENGKRNPS